MPPLHPLPGRADLAGRLIVSVQAPEGSPLRDPAVIAAMAEASLRQGAAGVRLESPEHIGAVRRRCPGALIVGLWKRSFPGSPVYITPGWEEIRAVWAAGADVIAIDATERDRPAGQRLESLIGRARDDLGAPLMADVDSEENGLRAAELGCAWVGTTLFGYTEATAARAAPRLEPAGTPAPPAARADGADLRGRHRIAGGGRTGPLRRCRRGGGGNRDHRGGSAGGRLVEGPRGVRAPAGLTSSRACPCRPCRPCRPSRPCRRRRPEEREVRACRRSPLRW